MEANVLYDVFKIKFLESKVFELEKNLEDINLTLVFYKERLEKLENLVAQTENKEASKEEENKEDTEEANLKKAKKKK